MIHKINEKPQRMDEIVTKLVNDNPGIMRKDVSLLLRSMGFNRCAIAAMIRKMEVDNLIIIDTSQRNSYRLYMIDDHMRQRTIPAVFDMPKQPYREPMAWLVWTLGGIA